MPNHRKQRAKQQFEEERAALTEGTILRLPGGPEDLPTDRPAPGFTTIVSSDGTVIVVKEKP